MTIMELIDKNALIAEIESRINFILQEPDEPIRFTNSIKFYLRKHFDFEGLIPMGLALEAPEGMYNTKTE